jgi:hypothetical protein
LVRLDIQNSESKIQISERVLPNILRYWFGKFPQISEIIETDSLKALSTSESPHHIRLE